MTAYDPPGDPGEEKKGSIYISPRLKAKLEGRIEEEEESASSGKWIGMAMVAGILIFGGWLGWSMMTGQKPEGTGHTANAEEAAPTPTPPVPAATDTAATAGETTTTPPSGSTISAAAQAAAAAAAARAQQTQRPMPAQPAPTETAGEPAPAAPARTYGIEVGTYLFEERATEVQQQLASSTSLDAKVVSRDEGGATTYAVVLGSFSSRGDAESKGSELLSAGTIRQSKVISTR